MSGVNTRQTRRKDGTDSQDGSSETGSSTPVGGQGGSNLTVGATLPPSGTSVPARSDSVPPSNPTDGKWLDEITINAYASEEAARAVISLESLYEDLVFKPVDVRGMRSRLKAAADSEFATTPDKQHSIATACLCQMLRGNNLERMTMTMTPKGKDILSNLIKVYGIKSKIVATDQPATITLARIVMCFPELCIKVASKYEVRLASAYTPDDLPRGMRFSSFGALIPMKKAFEPLKKAFCMYQAQNSLVYNKKPLDEVRKRNLTSQVGYVNQAMTSKLVKEEFQIQLLKTEGAGIIVSMDGDNVVFHKAILSLAAKYDRVVNIQNYDDM